MTTAGRAGLGEGGRPAPPTQPQMELTVPDTTNPPTAVALLRDAEAYLSALHVHVARHDNIGADLTCSGCLLRDRIAAALPVLTTVPSTEDLASADNPTPLRWGLNDVLWSDDDTVIVLLSGPDGEPYWLELDPERAAVLRQDLAGPDGEEPSARAAVLAAKLQQMLTTEPDDTKALAIHDVLMQVRAKFPCTCARSQGLHEKCCQRYVPGHELISPVRRLAAARAELRRVADEQPAPVPGRVVGEAQQDETQDDEEQFGGTRQCGHDDYHSAHEWADQPHTWCPGHSVDQPAVVSQPGKEA